MRSRASEGNGETIIPLVLYLWFGIWSVSRARKIAMRVGLGTWAAIKGNTPPCSNVFVFCSACSILLLGLFSFSFGLALQQILLFQCRKILRPGEPGSQTSPKALAPNPWTLNPNNTYDTAHTKTLSRLPRHQVDGCVRYLD